MNQLSIQDWKTFLRARIDQERGRDEQALGIFETLLRTYPDNPHLQASRSFALTRLRREPEAAASQIAAKYANLGRTLVGDKDNPEVWNNKLNMLLSDIEGFEKSGAMAAAAIAW